nr:hypothetical protein [Clostridia bacterium]
MRRCAHEPLYRKRLLRQGKRPHLPDRGHGADGPTLGWYSNIVARDSEGHGTYGVVFDMLPEAELVHLAPFTGMQLFRGTPQPRLISFMQVTDIQRLHDYVTAHGWTQITDIVTQPWGGKTCSLTTIDGYIINIFQ